MVGSVQRTLLMALLPFVAMGVVGSSSVRLRRGDHITPPAVPGYRNKARVFSPDSGARVG